MPKKEKEKKEENSWRTLCKLYRIDMGIYSYILGLVDSVFQLDNKKLALRKEADCYMLIIDS